VWVWLIACFFIHLLDRCVWFGWSVCDLVDACGDWRLKKCENSLGDKICVNYYGRMGAI